MDVFAKYRECFASSKIIKDWQKIVKRKQTLDRKTNSKKQLLSFFHHVNKKLMWMT